jgi:hypothetical protein
MVLAVTKQPRWWVSTFSSLSEICTRLTLNFGIDLRLLTYLLKSI